MTAYDINDAYNELTKEQRIEVRTEKAACIRARQENEVITMDIMYECLEQAMIQFGHWC